MRRGQFALHFDPQGDVLAAARQCEADVFHDTYGNSAEQWRAEYGPYDAASVFLAVTDPEGEAVATSRLILPNPAGLKSLVDAGREPWCVEPNGAASQAGMVASQTWDIATLAVRPGVAGAGLLSTALYHGIVAATQANALRWVVMIMDVRARRLLSMLNLETHVLPGAGPAPYLGSTASIPLWADVGQMMDTQSRLNPRGHRLIHYGTGLEKITIPTGREFMLRPRHLDVQDVQYAFAPGEDSAAPCHEAHQVSSHG